MTAMRSMPNYTFDADLEMKDSYACGGDRRGCNGGQRG
jgi:hypothetical protein